MADPLYTVGSLSTGARGKGHAATPTGLST